MTTNSAELLPTTPPWLKFVYKILGIVQFSYTTETTSVRAKICARLHCVLSCAYFINFIFLCNDFSYEVKVMRYVHFLVHYGHFLHMLILVLRYFLRSDKIKEILLHLRKIRVPLECSTYNRRHSFARIFLIVSYIPSLSLYVPFRKRTDSHLFYYMYPNIVILFDLLFMNDVMDAFSEKFGRVNRQLQLVVYEVKALDQNEQRIILRNEKIQKLSYSHCELVVLVQKVVKEFEITIIVSMVERFVNIVDCIYTVTVLVVNSEPVTSVRLWINFVFAIYLFFWLYVLVMKFSETQKVANKGGYILHEIWNKCLNKGVSGGNVRFMTLVSLRMLNTTLKFNMGGFFYLDWNFFYVVVASITTYLVILIQFYI
ncbi:hypothetical protein Zmor_026510 [Zophobas morio]|uniref:Gustatory receptor n=1 Tax=Zophobas morio TaxID=2755281 RepID=A0AA38M5C8_9CUCU|nr:hypothetical protein Zmor_026510 [Zophobas morio]